MKKIFFPLILVISIAWFPQKKTKVIFFGDSITELGLLTRPDAGKGYILKIDSLCKAESKSDQYDLIGAGVSGNKVYDLYLRIEEDVLAKKPDVVIIYVGVNDVWHKATSGTGTDADKFEKFYLAILKKFKDNNIKAILCTPAVIGEKTDFTNQLDGDLNAYSTIIRNLAKKNNLSLIDLRQKFLSYDKANNPNNLDRGILTRDKVHLNEAGNLLVAQEMWNAIKGM